MKMKKLLAVLSAGAIAVSSLSLTAFAANPVKATAVTVNQYPADYSAQDKTDAATKLGTVTAAVDSEDPTIINVNFSTKTKTELSGITADSAGRKDIVYVKVTTDAASNFDIGTFAFTSGYGWDDTTHKEYNVNNKDIMLWLQPTAAGDQVQIKYKTDSSADEQTLTFKYTYKEETTTPSSSSSTPASTTAATEEKIEIEEVKPSEDNAIPDGASLTIKTEDVSEIKVPEGKEEIVETIEKMVKNGDAVVLDIKLVDKSGKEVQVAEGSSVTVSFSVPSSVKVGYFKKVYVYRAEADGTFTDMKASLSEDRKTITFATVHFSTYIVTTKALDSAVVNDTDPAAETTAAETTAAPAGSSEAPADTTAAPAGTSNPEDKNQATGVALAIVPAVIAATGVVISKKRK